jgi:hypothetical protein
MLEKVKEETTMQRRGLVVLAVVLFVGSMIGLARAEVLLRFTLHPQVYISIPRSADVSVSVDRGEGATYDIGDPITIRFRTTRDGYVNLIDYLPGGDVQVLVRNRFVRAGISETYSKSVTGPGGTERLVVLLTRDPVSDRDLERFIQAPHQADRIFHAQYATDRTHFQVAARMEGTVLTLEPQTVQIGPSSALVFTASLSTASGQPLEGQELVWSTSDGSLATARTVTDARGMSRNTFYAPAFSGTVTVEVRFLGGVRLAPSSAVATVEVGQRIVETYLSLEPAKTVLASGERIRVVAYLRDREGRALAGRTIEWEVPQGTLSATSSVTDTSGRAWVFYTAPRVATTRDFDLVARFPGSAQYAPSEAFVTLTVERVRPVLSEALFFVDFSSGSPKHNGSRLSYQGKVVSGFSVNDVSLLEMRRGEVLEFYFSPGGVPEEGAVYLWVQGDPNTRVRVTLNGKDLGTVPAVTGLLAPGAEQRLLAVAGDFLEGTNVLRITAEGPARGVVRLQRVVVVF